MKFHMFNAWEDPVGSDRLQVVFNNRFKDYGAYQVRRLYHRNKVIAMLVATILVSGTLASFMIPRKRTLEVAPISCFTATNDTIRILDANPLKEWLENGSKGGTKGSCASKASGIPSLGDDGPPFLGLKTFGMKRGQGSGDADDLPPGGDSGGGRENAKKGSAAAPISIPCRFPQGEAAFIEFIKASFRVPEACQDYWAGGTALVRFKVNEQGYISQVEVLETSETCPEFKAETINVFKHSPKWIAGTVNGKFVSCWRQTAIVVTFD